MNNLETTAILEITVIGIAVAQALTILLTIRRERDIKELRELVDEQRLRIVELRAWLAGRNAVQPSRIKSERREPIPEPTANNIKAPEPEITPKDLSETMQSRTPKDLPDTIRPPTTDDELKRATNAINWLKEDADKARDIVASMHRPPAEKRDKP